MGVDTKGFVTGNFENRVFEVMSKVRSALNNFTTTNGFGNEIVSGRTCEFQVTPEIMSACCFFREGANNRTLWISFDCHGDNADVYEGEKLIFSLGMWGKSEEIIRQVLKQFEEPCYYTPNDCGIDYELFKA